MIVLMLDEMVVERPFSFEMNEKVYQYGLVIRVVIHVDQTSYLDQKFKQSYSLSLVFELGEDDIKFDFVVYSSTFSGTEWVLWGVSRTVVNLWKPLFFSLRGTVQDVLVKLGTLTGLNTDKVSKLSDVRTWICPGWSASNMLRYVAKTSIVDKSALCLCINRFGEVLCESFRSLSDREHSLSLEIGRDVGGLRFANEHVSSYIYSGESKVLRYRESKLNIREVDLQEMDFTFVGEEFDLGIDKYVTDLGWETFELVREKKVNKQVDQFSKSELEFDVPLNITVGLEIMDIVRIIATGVGGLADSYSGDYYVSGIYVLGDSKQMASTVKLARDGRFHESV